MAFDTGQFSVNGQRASSNYWTVDGVSANIGIGATASPGSGLAGALGLDQRIWRYEQPGLGRCAAGISYQTSTYAPEFGRTAGRTNLHRHALRNESISRYCVRLLSK